LSSASSVRRRSSATQRLWSGSTGLVDAAAA